MCMHPQLGEIDKEAGELWVGNPFQLVNQGDNLSAYERNRLYLNVDGQRFIDASFASADGLLLFEIVALRRHCQDHYGANPHCARRGDARAGSIFIQLRAQWRG